MPNHCSKVFSLILTMVLSGLGFMSSVFGQTAVIMNPNGRLTSLETLGGGWSQANEINDAGQVVGWSETTEGNRHAFITGRNGFGIKDLGTLRGSWSEALGINESGQVVGASETATGSYHAFITGPNGLGMRDLGTLGGSWSQANGINNAGQVVGRSETAGGELQAFITGPDGERMALLASGFPPETSSDAADINDRGQVVGRYSGETDPETYPGIYIHAFVTGPNGVGVTDLGTGSYDHSEGTGINSAGQAIGDLGYFSLGGGAYTSSFITGPNGEGMTQFELDAGSEWAGSIANGINDAGQVVGYLNADPYDNYEGDPRHAFIAGPDNERIIDLNSYADLPDGTYLSEAQGINNLGQIVASLDYRDAAPPIPEPETYALMLAGLGLIGFVVHRRKSEARI